MSKMKTMKTKTRMNLVGWGFALPAVLGFLIFNLFPMLLSGYYSLCDYNIIGKPSWVGLKNYIELLSGHEKTFWISVKATVLYSIMAVPANCASFKQGYQMQSLLPVVVLPALYSSGSCHELCVAPSDEPGFRPFQHGS